VLREMRDTEEQNVEYEVGNDGASQRVLGDISSGKGVAGVLLKEMIRNKQVITKDLSPLLVLIASLVLNRQEYENLVYEYISKTLDKESTLYTMLMVAVNKATMLESEHLAKNWLTTLGVIVESLLDGEVTGIREDQVLIYLDKLGRALFHKDRSEEENWLGVFFVYSAKQQPLYKFLDEHAKNSWRIDLNFNLLCTIDNLLFEEDPDTYEITMLKLAYYRSYL
jgi:hypothetical protein